MIASIAIGLAVDDTVHYLFRYNVAFKKDLDKEWALEKTIHQVGRPIIFTTITIIMGFSILIFSSFKPTMVFGIIMVITMLSALVGDLILLPSLMMHLELVTLWDLIRLKTGKGGYARRGLSLFEGLSRTHIHYILMAGAIKEMESREVLFHKGEVGDSMYAVISGTVDLVNPLPGLERNRTGRKQKFVERLKPGSIVGAPGFIRSSPRNISAVAAEPAELLQINRRMIRRLQWLYPPAAQKFLMNLMVLLCNRLEGLSLRLRDFSSAEMKSGLLTIENFLEILESEVEQARAANKRLSLCLMELNIARNKGVIDEKLRQTVFHSISRIFASQKRKQDILGRFDSQTFIVLMPDTSIRKAARICQGAEQIIREEILKIEGLSSTVEYGFVELSMADENGWELIARATQELHARPVRKIGQAFSTA
jgi:diguanylate cyclase (GGDEF)-like protein